MLSIAFDPKEDDVREGCRNVKKTLHNVHSSPNIKESYSEIGGTCSKHLALRKLTKVWSEFLHGRNRLEERRVDSNKNELVLNKFCINLWTWRDLVKCGRTCSVY